MYILLCGYPPFYSKHSLPISPGMKTKIRTGEYRFPEEDWCMVSDEAKNLIQAMLTVEPEKRPNIETILKSSWLSEFTTHPNTPLNTSRILMEELEQWDDIEAAICETNKYNRMPSDEKIDISTSDNGILQRRQERQNNNNKK
ncbi:unnamed protein product [Didymodactylos carnosus]|uniref:non-specific serine/threonine protein kinase n=1 Tax=Didymodactylos carnosus TaxID=1234261 RepID=A0A8S2WVK9_9BILA|nr:unnamed protein product [Didymodactylos carnosus]